MQINMHKLRQTTIKLARVTNTSLTSLSNGFASKAATKVFLSLAQHQSNAGMLGLEAWPRSRGQFCWPWPRLGLRMLGLGLGLGLDHLASASS